jgi:ribose/xylose/arabinose/galactoside ABC-type transport system permease subunit
MKTNDVSKNLSEEFVQTIVTLCILVLIMFVVILLTPSFLTLKNLNNILIQVSLVMLVGSAVTMLLISGNFDLSIGGIVVQAGVLFAMFCQLGLPTGISMILGILSGTVVGFINSYLVVNMRISAIIATIGTMYISRGIANILADGSMIEAGLPLDFRNISTFFVGPINLVLFIVIVINVIFLYVQKKTSFGRNTYYIGANKNTAVLSGIDVKKIVRSLYILVGTMAGLCGIVLAAKLGAGDCRVGEGFEMDAIAAAVVGGASINGGKGSVLGTIIGALIIGVLSNALNLLNEPSYYQYVVKGIVLVAAILVQRVIYKKIANRTKVL